MIRQSSGAVWKSWAPVPNKPTVSVDVKQHFNQQQPQSSGAVWKSWAPVPNKPTVSVDVKQHFNQQQPQSSGAVWKSRWMSWTPVPDKPTVSVDVKQHSTSFVLRRYCAVDRTLTLSLPWSHLETAHKSAKFETVCAFSSSFLHWHVKGFSSKRIALKLDVWYRTGKYTVCRRVRALFSPKILQAGAVTGVNSKN